MKTGEEIAAEVLELLKRQFEVEANALSPPRRKAVYAVGPQLVESMLSAYLVLLSKGYYGSVNLSGSLQDFCSSGVAAVADADAEDAALAAAASTLRSVASALLVFTTPPAAGDPPLEAKAMIAGMKLGQANVRMAHVLIGMWEIIAAADVNQQIAAREAARRKRAGEGRGAELREGARQWKDQLLPLAIEIERKHPRWNRQQIAVELLQVHKLENEIGLKSIENWLKDEAEAPNGPLRSHARRKAAKLS